MERYQVAGSERGPWLELVVTNQPQAALTKARASFDWPVVWVAKMRPIMGKDLLPSKEQLRGDMMERIHDQFGAQLVDQLSDEINLSQLYDELCNAATVHLLDIESSAMVPEIVRAYRPEQNVRAQDFVRGEAPARPSLKDLIS